MERVRGKVGRIIYSGGGSMEKAYSRCDLGGQYLLKKVRSLCCVNRLRYFVTYTHAGY